MSAIEILNCFSRGYFFQEKQSTPSEKLMQELSQHSQSRALVEEAQKVIQRNGLGALKVCFESTKSGFNALRDKNIIKIRPDLSANDKRFSLIFELTNVIQDTKHRETWESAIKGVYKNPEEYARAMEYTEFCGLKRAHIVSQALNREKGFSYVENPWKNIPLENMEFDTYYKSFLDDKHKEYYRKGWRTLEEWRTRQIFLN